MNRRTFVKGGTALGASALAASAGAKASLRTSNHLYPDSLFTKPYVDIDEWRDTPVRHRYVHGGFAGTELLFSIYFPPAEQYQRRFLHPVMHICGDENVAPNGRLAGIDGDSIPFAVASGAFLVESNQGTKLMHTKDASVGAFRASAAAAQYARILAAKMYGAHRPYGYIYGGSGGGYKALACAENTDVWDGAVPFIHGSPFSLPNVFTVQAHALRVLDGKFAQIVDALQPGGSGDIYAGLDAEQRAALKEVTLMGFPPRGWYAHERLALNYTAVLASVISVTIDEDPSYLKDFWTKPGYLGANPPQSLLDARIRHKTTIASIVTTAEARKLGLPVGITAGTSDTSPAALRLASVPRGRLQGCFMFPRTGTGVGERLMITGVVGDLMMLGFSGHKLHREAVEGIRPGDALDLDNSDYLAVQTYHRHQNPPPEFYTWDQFRRPDGTPFYPQRPIIKGYDQVGEGNSFQTGRFGCKMITVNCTMDEAAYPWQADWYRTTVMKALGDRFEDRYRLWFVDNAMHVNPSRYLMPTEGDVPKEHHGPTDTHLVSYAGVLQQALRDVAAWAEKGIAPPRESKYHVENSQIILPARAMDRRGIQPVVDLAVNRGERADVKAGESFELVGTIEAPPGGGAIVSAEWDFDGQGLYSDTESWSDGAVVRTVSRTHSFGQPGTYFVTLRATAQRKDAVGTPFGKLVNLARARIVVS